MLIALKNNGTRIRPIKKVMAYCPLCGNEVIAKMGVVKVHHWAHKEKSDCFNGRGMTEWHYRWIARHFEKPGWEVEFVDGKRRYDCFNKDKRLVLEIQKVPLYDYLMEKTHSILNKGYNVNWIFHMGVFDSFLREESHFAATSRQRRVILDILEWFAEVPAVAFYVDSLAYESNGRSSKGLLKLLPTSKESNIASFTGYYEIQYKPISSQ